MSSKRAVSAGVEMMGEEKRVMSTARSTPANGNHASQGSQRVQIFCLLFAIIHKCQLPPILWPCVSCPLGSASLVWLLLPNSSGPPVSHPMDYGLAPNPIWSSWFCFGLVLLLCNG